LTVPGRVDESGGRIVLVIDFHLHVTRTEEYNEWFLDWMRRLHGERGLDQLRTVLASPEGLLRYMDEQGIDYVVALAETNTMVTGVSTNDRVAEFCRGSDRLIPFGNINPYVTYNRTAELEKCVSELGIKGFKLYPTYQHFYPNENRLFPLYERAQDLSIPVMIHTGSSVFPGSLMKYGDPLFLDEIAVFFPELKIIQSHAGRGFWYDRAFFLAGLHKNVYMDITGLPPQNLLKYFPDLERNAEKIIFGSDWPGIIDIKRNVRAIKELPISPSTKAKILGKNAAALLGLRNLVG
jgi:predicted TIM-barrel fold metal-dependent hydrolase